jgi:hypothetical protein
LKTAERLTQHTRTLPPLKVGDHVRLQNQVGLHPRQWDLTGVVVEVLQFNQYRIRIDGSGRVTLRNRQFLRHFQPVREQHPLPALNETFRYPRTPLQLPEPATTPSLDTTPPDNNHEETANHRSPVNAPDAAAYPQDSVITGLPHDPPAEDAAPPTPRRSGRTRHPPAWLADYATSLSLAQETGREIEERGKMRYDIHYD